MITPNTPKPLIYARYRPWAAVILLIMLALCVPFLQTLWAIGLLAIISDNFSQGTLLSFTIILTGISVALLLLPWQGQRLAHHHGLKSASTLLWRYFGVVRFNWRDFLPCLGWLVIVMLMTEMIGRLFNLDPSQFMRPLLIDTSPWLLFVAVALIVPIYEELLFRGIGWRLAADIFFRSKHSVLYSSLFISLIFAVVHIQYLFIEMVMVAALSLVFCYARWRTDSLLAPILLHIINNSLAFIFLIAS